jgi:ubiquinone/menaquinone biosynthesis C-methylase UbiE
MHPQEQSQKTIFNKSFKNYKSYHLEPWQKFYIDRIFAALDLNEGDTFLDIGVGGRGYTVIEAAKKVGASVGVDLSEEGVKKATQFSKQLGLENVTLANCSAEALPFQDDYFTKISSIAVLEHVENDNKAFDEISRIIKIGGRIHICVPNSYMHMPLLLGIANLINDKKVGHLRHYYPNDMIRSFESRGFRLLELEYHAHNIKLLAYGLSLIPMPPKAKESLMGYCDQLDRKKKDDPRSMNFSITMIKEK